MCLRLCKFSPRVQRSDVIRDTHSSFVLHSMDGALKVVLLAALILLVSAETPDTTKFPKELQVHIDNALKNVRDTYKDHHVAFHSLKGDPRVSAVSILK